MTATLLMAEIEQHLPAGGDWCKLDKSQTLAALVLGLRPSIVVELGVWMGGSLIPMAIAMRENQHGKIIAIDPWSPDASIADQGAENVAWWSGIDHERAYQDFLARVRHHQVNAYVEIWRRPSDDCTPPREIDLLHIDGNHGPQAARDVERFCPHVRVGGIAILDDVGWEGSHVKRGVDLARAMGFIDLYPLGTGLVMTRISKNT